jgi:hypothetical protein
VGDEGVLGQLWRHDGRLYRSGFEPDFGGAPKIVLADSAEEGGKSTSVTMDAEEKMPASPITGVR